MWLLLDYEILRVICWTLLVFLLMTFVVLGCFQWGISILLPVLAKDDLGRGEIVSQLSRTKNNALVLLLLFGIVLYTAWPMIFSVTIHCLSFVVLCLSLLLIIYPLNSFIRKKLKNKSLRCSWDKFLFVIGLFSVFILGVVFGHLLIGLPFYLEGRMSFVFLTGTGYLLTPFSLISGLLAVSINMMHTAVFIHSKISQKYRKKTATIIYISTLISLLLFLVTGFWLIDIEGYHLLSQVFPNAESNPMYSQVKTQAGLWFDNYGHLTGLWSVPVSVFIAGLMTVILVRVKRIKMALLFSSFTIAATFLTVVVSMFPFIIPSSISANSSLTVWDSSADLDTLNTLFWCAVFSLPLFGWYVWQLICRAIKTDI